MKNIVVIGAGTMGNGIAHVFALASFKVTLIDVNEEALANATINITKNMQRQVDKGQISKEKMAEALECISEKTDINDGVLNADLIIEAATENEETKLQIFNRLDMLAPPHCILASNTSSISITKIASATKRPGKVIGMHFMNPVPVMKLVEIINGYATEKAVSEQIMALSQQLGKQPYLVNDYPGFIANRILMPMINEAICALYEGVAGVEEIDQIMKLGMAHPMGPLQLADFIGLDVCLAILQVLQSGFGQPKYAPCPLLVNMVMANQLGIKTLSGFYRYGEDRKISGVNG